MDAADPRLEGCAEPLYDPVRGATSSAVTQTTVTQNSAHAPLFTFGPNATITRLNASAWYIGTNGRTRGLYQSTLINTGGVASVQAQEVAEGVQNMAVTYLVDGTTSYGDAVSTAGRWSQVTAVRITLTLAGTDRDGVDNAALSRTVSQVITLRNRAP
ncbi:PilW family protein [Xanthomonas phaseoli]|uniref:PilW family protein n=1 Tax=Xanthomonas phaseoli TaxID=1985254 RepID=UPI001F162ADA|nr:PilW family protein [Xanthomonas phaseoli]